MARMELFGVRVRVQFAEGSEPRSADWLNLRGSGRSVI